MLQKYWMYYEETRIWTPIKSYRRNQTDSRGANEFFKAKSLCFCLSVQTAFLKATEYTKDFTSYAININIILHIFYLVCRSWNHAGFTQDICSSNGDNTILSVVCSFLLLLVIIYPWLSNIYNASYY